MLKLKLLSTILLAFFCSNAFCQTKAKESPVRYFIDADCSGCSVPGYDSTKIWAVTPATYAGDKEKQDVLRNKFKEAIEKRFGAVPALSSRIVFRFDNSQEKLQESYTNKEQKMKTRGYAIIKIDFSPN